MHYVRITFVCITFFFVAILRQGLVCAWWKTLVRTYNHSKPSIYRQWEPGQDHQLAGPWHQSLPLAATYTHLRTHVRYLSTHDTWAYATAYTPGKLRSKLTDCTIYGNGIVATSWNCAQLEKEGRRETFRSNRRIVKAQLLCVTLHDFTARRVIVVLCVANNVTEYFSSMQRRNRALSASIGTENYVWQKLFLHVYSGLFKL